MSKKNKAEAIIKLLKKGYSPKEVTQRMAVSYNYAWKLKKELEKAAKEAFTPEEVGVSEETFIEAALAASQGKGKGKGKERVVGTMERKVPGGPATIIRATTEDRVNRVLDERATTYGSFVDVARMAQRLKSVAHTAAGEQGKTFAADQAEALDMIFSKLARILNGDPNHTDSWIDIAGYATLVSDRLQGKTR